MDFLMDPYYLSWAFVCYHVPKPYHRRQICNYIEANEPKLISISLRCNSFPLESTVRIKTDNLKCELCKRKPEVTYTGSDSYYLQCRNCCCTWDRGPEYSPYEYFVPNGNVICIVKRKHFKGWSQRQTVEKDVPSKAKFLEILERRERFEIEIPKDPINSKKKLAEYIDSLYVEDSL